MQAGMVFAVASAMLELALIEVLFGGAVNGILVRLLTYAADASLGS